MPSKLNIFTAVAVDTSNHGNIVDDLEEIAARLNLLIHSVQALASGSPVVLDIPVKDFCDIISSLVKVRHWFKFQFSLFFTQCSTR